MVTLRLFIGSLLEQVTRARTLSDAASVRVAHQYLQHDFLKGFPVPRMQVKEVEFELNFAVAEASRSSAFGDVEVQTNITHKVRQLAATLPDDENFRTYFAGHPRLRERWNANLDTLDERVGAALAKGSTDREALIRSLSLVVENYCYESLSNQPWERWLSVLAGALHLNRGAGEVPHIADYIDDQIRNYIVAAEADPDGGDAAENFLDVNVVVEGAELKKLPGVQLQRMKIVFSSSDRKWLASEKNGEKSYILDRH